MEDEEVDDRDRVADPLARARVVESEVDVVAAAGGVVEGIDEYLEVKYVCMGGVDR